MYSPRSVSTGRMPAASSASLSRISSAAIDFDLATSFASRRRQTSTTYAHASSAVAQTATWPPRASSARRELLQVAVDVADRLHADVVRALAPLLDVGKLGPGVEPVTAQASGRAVDRALDVVVGELRAGDLAEVLPGLAQLAHLSSSLHARVEAPGEHGGEVCDPGAAGAARARA